LFLKEIGIKGFKSFANKMKLNITPGITVIVGPNGCGKSNIIDAVRWILGEQNIRSLRGNRITDMIFAGNPEQKIKNFAQVYMLFDNAERKFSIDSEEVEIKRIIYRSGEIENYINGIPCRLKDIQELLLGSGLGRNSYSIIAQGKVDFILNAKPSERRILFEEASDVSIYRNRKEKSLKKLEVIENNILRVNDILYEVENTLSNYKKKSDDLDTYQYYQEHILKMEFYLIYQQYRSLKSNILKNSHNIQSFKENIKKTDNMVLNYKEEISQTELEKEELENQLEEHLKQSKENEISKNNLINHLTALNQKKIDIDRLIQNNQEDRVSAENQYNKFTDNLAAIEEDITIAGQKENDLKERLKENELLLEKCSYINSYYKGKILAVESISKDIGPYYNNYRVATIKKEEEEKAKNISFSQVEAEIKQLTNRIADYRKQIEKIILEISFLEQSVNQLNETEKEKKTELTRMEELIHKENSLLQKYFNDIGLKNKEIALLKELLNTIQNGKIDDLDKIIKKNSFDGILSFCELKNIIFNIPDNLKNVFDFILDDGIKYLHILNSDKIPILTQNYKIKSTSRIKIAASNLFSTHYYDLKTLNLEKEVKKGKIIGFASQLISFPQEFEDLINIVLGNILIVEDMATAFVIAKQIKGKLAIISLDGIMIDERGMVSIGFALDELIKDRHEISQKRIMALEKEIDSIDSEWQKRKLIIEAEKEKYNFLLHETKEVGKKLSNLIIKINEKKVQLSENRNNILTAQSLLDSLKKRQSKLLEDIEDSKRMIKILDKDISIIKKFLDSIILYNNCLFQYKNNSISMVDEIKRNIDSFKMKISWNREREELLRKRKTEMEQFVNSYQQEEKGKEEKLNSYNNNYAQLAQQEIGLKEKLDTCQNKENKLTDDINRIKEILKEKEYFLKKARGRIEEGLEQLNNEKNELHECEMILVQNQEKLNHLLQTVNNQYNTTIDEILSYKNYAKNQKEASLKISQFKEKIKSMGQINYNAPLEYQEQLVKFKELSHKKEEIVQSKEKLLSLIEEIDRIAKDQFYNTFQAVELNFKEIFEKLFHGGQASLELTDNKKLLETGIEVLVQPPGKQVQNISLLSAGEKALTAIALLFALWKANPTPFCFFDEIDSALDDYNAVRLSSFIRDDFLKKSQIIMITHQKEVMKVADALYGITMDGYGTSKLMSVRMVETEGNKNQ
jgi:chromosome segregation protein